MRLDFEKRSKNNDVYDCLAFFKASEEPRLGQQSLVLETISARQIRSMTGLYEEIEIIAFIDISLRLTDQVPRRVDHKVQRP